MDVFWDGTCDIRLAAPFVGSFGVKEIKFSRRMSILLKSYKDLEFTDLAQMVDFQLIRDIVGDILQSMVVLPNRMKGLMMWRVVLLHVLVDVPLAVLCVVVAVSMLGQHCYEGYMADLVQSYRRGGSDGLGYFPEFDLDVTYYNRKKGFWSGGFLLNSGRK